MKFAFSVVVFCFSTKYSFCQIKDIIQNDRCQMMVLLWSFISNVFGNYLIKSKVVLNKLTWLFMYHLLHPKGSLFVAQN